MWKTPLFLEHINTYVFFLDTEGYLANDPIKECLVIILLIISSLTILNTKYEGDFHSDFKIFSNILKKFYLFHEDNHEDLKLCLSKLLVIQRDFKHNWAQDSNASAYNVFEKNIEDNSDLNEIKKSLKKLFRERDYMVCSTPIIEEMMLSNLIIDLGQKVTENFNQELNKIRDKLLYQIKPKCMFKLILKPKMMGYFVKDLVREINECLLKEKSSQKLLLISNVWKNAEEDMLGEAMHDACDYYYDELQRFFNEDKPRKRGILFKLLSTMREEVVLIIFCWFIFNLI